MEPRMLCCDYQMVSLSQWVSSFISAVTEYSFKPTLQTDQIFSCFGTSSEDAALSILLKHDVAANIITYMNNKLNMNTCITCIKKKFQKNM